MAQYSRWPDPVAAGRCWPRLTPWGRGWPDLLSSADGIRCRRPHDRRFASPLIIGGQRDGLSRSARGSHEDAGEGELAKLPLPVNGYSTR
jgi:hypothetical protein